MWILYLLNFQNNFISIYYSSYSFNIPSTISNNSSKILKLQLPLLNLQQKNHRLSAFSSSLHLLELSSAPPIRPPKGSLSSSHSLNSRDFGYGIQRHIKLQGTFIHSLNPHLNPRGPNSAPLLISGLFGLRLYPLPFIHGRDTHPPNWQTFPVVSRCSRKG